MGEGPGTATEGSTEVKAGVHYLRRRRPHPLETLVPIGAFVSRTHPLTPWALDIIPGRSLPAPAGLQTSSHDDINQPARHLDNLAYLFSL